VKPVIACIACALFTGCSDELISTDVRTESETRFAAHAERPSEPIAHNVEPLKVGPVALFQNYCARCHGDYGWGFAPGFTEKKSDDELLSAVRLMVAGPAQQTLEPRELDALADLHRAIDAINAGESGKFAAIIADGARDTLPGSEDFPIDGRGAWAGAGLSGRLFGEIEPGDVDAPG